MTCSQYRPFVAIEPLSAVRMNVLFPDGVLDTSDHWEGGVRVGSSAFT